MKILSKENLTRIGFVNKTTGFKGKLSCVTDIARPEKLLQSKFFFLILEGLPVPFAIEEIEMKGDDIIVKFEDVDSEEQAKKLLRKEIFADKLKGKNKQDLISWKDLIGYAANDASFGKIGIIEDVFEYPMHTIAKTSLNGVEILFPLNDDVILEINDDEKIVFIDLPEGLLDIYLK